MDTKQKVLLIDDDQGVHAIISRMLQTQSISVDAEVSARQALDRLLQTRYDAILCDMWMPGMNGREFYEEVEKQFPGLESRVVFLTGDLASESTWEFIEDRNLPYVLKPVNPADLYKRLQQVIGGESRPMLGDKRRHRRVPLKVSARIRYKRWPSVRPEVVAIANACKDGIYFLSNREYRLGTEVLVCFPYTGGEELEQQGCVARLDVRPDGQWGVAIALGEAAVNAQAALGLIVGVAEWI